MVVTTSTNGTSATIGREGRRGQVGDRAHQQAAGADAAGREQVRRGRRRPVTRCRAQATKSVNVVRLRSSRPCCHQSRPELAAAADVRDREQVTPRSSSGQHLRPELGVQARLVGAVAVEQARGSAAPGSPAAHQRDRDLRPRRRRPPARPRTGSRPATAVPPARAPASRRRSTRSMVEVGRRPHPALADQRGPPRRPAPRCAPAATLSPTASGSTSRTVAPRRVEHPQPQPPAAALGDHDVVAERVRTPPPAPPGRAAAARSSAPAPGVASGRGHRPGTRARPGR